MTKKVLGYIRVSSQEQVDDGASLKRQEEKIFDYCKLKGLSQITILKDEGESGFKSSRKGYQALIRACSSKEVDIVIVYDLSRLSRCVRDTLEFIEDRIHKNDIEFVSLQNDIDTTTPMGKAFLGITAILNQFQRDETAYKTRLALAHKIMKGEKTGGIEPFGFELAQDGKLAPKRGEIDTCRYIFKLREKGLSLSKIVAELHRLGIKTKTGKERWYPNTVRQILNRRLDELTRPQHTRAG